MLDISDIHQLRLISELGSLGKAAERLHMTPSTLSKRLHRLEKQLGVVLFHRSAEGMAATGITDYLLAAGQDLQQRLRLMQRHVELMANLKEGSLRLGVGPIVEQLFFPTLLLVFAREHPSIRFSLRVGSGAQLLDWLNVGEIDLAAGPFDITTLPPGLCARHLRDEPVILVARSGHPLAKQAALTLEDIQAYPVIGPHIPTHLTELAEMPHIACDNYATARGVLLASDHLSGGPESIFSEEICAGSLVRLPFDIPMRWVAHTLVWSATQYLPAVARCLELLHGRQPLP